MKSDTLTEKKIADMIREGPVEELAALLQRHIDALQQQLSAAQATIEKLQARELDNHHNALTCPYCNPKGLVLIEPDAQATIQRLEAEKDSLFTLAMNRAHEIADLEHETEAAEATAAPGVRGEG
jgi:hypothetical protein